METNKFFQIINAFLILSFVIASLFSTKESAQMIGLAELIAVFSWGAWSFGKSMKF